MRAFKGPRKERPRIQLRNVVVTVEDVEGRFYLFQTKSGATLEPGDDFNVRFDADELFEMKAGRG